MNFKTVTELKGGILQWRKMNYAEKKMGTPLDSGLSISDFNNLVDSEKLVVVSYYAKWCAPCKVMKPILEEISTEMSDIIKLVRIDYDENLALMKTLGIHGLPSVHFFSSNELLESRRGFMDKKQLQEVIDRLTVN
jgi:thioredoxin